MSGLVTHHEIKEEKGFKITAVVKNGVATATVFSGATLLFQRQDKSLEVARDAANDFLNDEKQIEAVIARNHRAFLEKSGITPADTISHYTTAEHPRVTHCYSCQHGLSSAVNLACKKCRWLLCSCGACGCGYTSYW
jgi:hypothetical protein